MIWQSLLEPLQFTFMQRGLVEVVLVGALCGAVGGFVISRGLSFMGDAIAHAIFPGLIIAYLLKFSFFVGALAVGVLSALGIGALSGDRRVKEDTAIGIVFAGAFALGVVMISHVRTYTADIGAILFGNVLGVSEADVALTLLCGGAVIVMLLLLFKELLLVAFDRTLATAMGLPVARLDQLLLLLLTLTIVVSLQAVGNILVLAMLITPAATARLFVQRFHYLLALGSLIGALCGVSGLYLSYYLNLASGGTIVLLSTLVFVVCFVCAPADGWLAARLRRWRRQPA